MAPVLEYLHPTGPRTARNYKLPTELVCWILAIIFDDYTSSIRDIMHVSQVCRHWRQAALGFKKIWSTIADVDSKSEPWIQELILRSGDYPLTIKSVPEDPEIECGHRLSSPKWMGLWKHFGRMESIDLNIFLCDTFVPNMLSFHAPVLKVLNLTFKDFDLEYESDDEDHSIVPMDFDLDIPKLFQGYSPNLRCLILNHIIVNPSQLKHCKLTHLDVTQMPAIDITAWLEMLDNQREMKNLRLDLEDVDFEKYIGSRDQLRPSVSLPNLESFVHRFNSQTSADLFGYLILPLSCDISLTWKVLYYGDPYIDPIGSINPMYEGLKRRFDAWADELKSSSDKLFFWQIEIGNEGISITASTVQRLILGDQAGSPLKLTFEFLPEDADGPNDFDEAMDEIGAKLFDMVIRSGRSVMEYRSCILILQTYPLRAEKHPLLISELTSFMSLLSPHNAQLILRGDRINDFMSHVLIKTPIYPLRQTRIVFEGDIEEESAAKQTLIAYMQRRSQLGAGSVKMHLTAQPAIRFAEEYTEADCNFAHCLFRRRSHALSLGVSSPFIQFCGSCSSCPF